MQRLETETQTDWSLAPWSTYYYFVDEESLEGGMKIENHNSSDDGYSPEHGRAAIGYVVAYTPVPESRFFSPVVESGVSPIGRNIEIGSCHGQLQHGKIPYPEVSFQEQNVCQENENVCQENENFCQEQNVCQENENVCQEHNVCHANVYREPVVEKQILSQISESEIYQQDTFHSHQPQYSILPDHLDDGSRHGLQSQDITQQPTRQQPSLTHHQFPVDHTEEIGEGTNQLPVSNLCQMSEQGSVASSSCRMTEMEESSNPLIQFRGLLGPLLDNNMMQPSTPLGRQKKPTMVPTLLQN
jgi:hypothetical protein